MQMRKEFPETFLDRAPFLYLWRPLYRRILVPHAYPLISKVMALLLRPFLAEQQEMSAESFLIRPEIALVHSEVDLVRSELSVIRSELAMVQLDLGNLSNTLTDKMDKIYVDSLGQWSEMEHALVTTLRLAGQSAEKHSELLERSARHQTTIQAGMENLSALRDAHRRLHLKVAREASDRRDFWKELENLLVSALSQPHSDLTQSTSSNNATPHG